EHAAPSGPGRRRELRRDLPYRDAHRLLQGHARRSPRPVRLVPGGHDQCLGTRPQSGRRKRGRHGDGGHELPRMGSKGADKETKGLAFPRNAAAELREMLLEEMEAPVAPEHAAESLDTPVSVSEEAHPTTPSLLSDELDSKIVRQKDGKAERPKERQIVRSK